MKISCFDIQNFRKLKKCRVELSDSETVFVGANNSGKTSAMDALIVFLKESRRKDLSTRDLTLCNWSQINKIGQSWLDDDQEEEKDINIFDISRWRPYVPTLDIWLKVDSDEVHYVRHLIPTLDWDGGLLGVRLILEPKKIEDLYKSFKKSFIAASSGNKKDRVLRLWPQSLRDFLDKELHKHFTVNAYILDPTKADEESPQVMPIGALPITSNTPFKGLFKIDVINAQRGFTDPNSQEGNGNKRKLSTQFKTYFENHLNPNELPDDTDLDALEAIESARGTFDERLKESFKESIGELEKLNYPGFSDPKIELSSRINPLDGLNHDASIQFRILTGKEGEELSELSLPEQYNGLGYQNLISMIFDLIRSRDEWMRVGKVGKRLEAEESYIEPLHIVLIEEPEAHLHAQVQQVFIKKAYSVLRNHKDLGQNTKFSSQLVVSTHSSHIAHEVDFGNLRYFKRKPSTNKNNVPFAEVINLTSTFGDECETGKFATRYLKATHCDLFFADASVLVEGPAERMLVPHFIKDKFPELDKSYLSILEIGGSHAHKLRPLIEKLELLTLVITDLDSIAEKNTTKVLPQKGEKYRTSNSTIKTWLPCKTDLDDVLSAKKEDKISKDKSVRVAYQYEFETEFKGEKYNVIPYTFEDAIVLSNVRLFRNTKDVNGLLKKMVDAVSGDDIKEACTQMFEALGRGSKKAEMALELLYTVEPDVLNVPEYISEGLIWLQNELKKKHQDFLTSTEESGDE